MAYLRLRDCIVLIGLSLGITCINAEGPTKKIPQTEGVDKHLWETKNILSVEVSPDNKHVFVLYSTPQVSFSADGKISGWIPSFLIRSNYKEPSASDGRAYDIDSIALPMWTPDSQGVSYLAQGDKSTSLWVSSVSDFKAQKILELEDDILGYQWSPDGKKVAVLVNKTIQDDALKVVDNVDRKNLMKLYTLDVNNKMEISNLTALTPDIMAPRTYDSNYSQSFTWTPDSQHIVYSYYPLSKEEGYDLGQLDLIHVTTRESKTLAIGEGTNLFPIVSPDSNYVAYISNILPENANNPIRVYGTDAARVCIVDLKDNKKQCLARTPNENPQLVGWKKDGKSVFVVDQEGNASQIYELGMDGKSIFKFSSGQQVLNNVHVNASGESIGYAAGDLQTAADAYATSVDVFKPQKITSFSDSRVKDDVLVEDVQWKSKDQKFDLEGVLIYSKTSVLPFPLITILNDYSKTASTLGYVGDLTSYPISILNLLNKGYGIFIPNRRGTNGYGVAFRQAIYKELGGEEFQDVLSGIDALIEKQKVNPNQLAIWGWGYGGYLSAWAMTQTDRFKTVVVGSGIGNLISQIGTSTEPAILNAIMGEPFWKDWKTWREKSPISHVKSMNTPTLIQTIPETGYIPRTQSEELFFPLRSHNIPVQMIIYIQKSHRFSDPHVTLMAI